MRALPTERATDPNTRAGAPPQAALGSDIDARIAEARHRLAEARRQRPAPEPPQPRLVGTLRLDLLLR
jgi:hypothetical protein